MLNPGNLLTQTARRHPSRIGLVHGARRWTWGELERSANGLARALAALGIERGDRVIVQSPNSRWMLEAQYALLRAGAVYIPVHARAIPRETAQMVGLAGAKALILPAGLAANAIEAEAQCSTLQHVIVCSDTGEIPPHTPGRAQWHDYDRLARAHAGETLALEVAPDDICLQMFTAGTTGVPKGGMHSNRGFMAALTGRIADVMPGLDIDSALLAIGPLSHGTGTTATCCVMRGAKIVMLEGHFDVGACWRLIEAERISELFTVPTILMDLVRHPDAQRRDRSSLRHVVYAGAPINRTDQKRALELLGPALVQYYGSVENMGTASVLHPWQHSLREDDPEAPVGTAGVARSGVRIAIRDADGRDLPAGETGEIWIDGPGNFLGYQNMPEATAAALKDGWVSSGDLGRLDERGFLYIQGRSREMYKSGGLQVYPNETQNYLGEHPAIAEAHVLSLPDSRWGEIGVAVVQLKAGAAATEAELRAFLRTRMAAYKLPRRAWIWDEIPRSPVGKVPKPLLKAELLARGLVREGEDVPGADQA